MLLEHRGKRGAQAYALGHLARDGVRVGLRTSEEGAADGNKG